MSDFDDATDRATASAREGERPGLIPDPVDPPSRSASGREGDAVAARRGGLALSREGSQGRLRRLRPAKA